MFNVRSVVELFLLVEFFFIRDAEGKLNKKHLIAAATVVGVIILIGAAIYGLPRESKDIPDIIP